MIVSASVLKHEREKYEKLGCSEILQKPFSTEQVHASVQNLLAIEYAYETKENQEFNSNSFHIDYLKVNFPQNLVAKLNESTQLGNITFIEKILMEL